jgi:hypothetical protein
MAERRHMSRPDSPAPLRGDLEALKLPIHTRQEAIAVVTLPYATCYVALSLCRSDRPWKPCTFQPPLWCDEVPTGPDHLPSVTPASPSLSLILPYARPSFVRGRHKHHGILTTFETFRSTKNDRYPQSSPPPDAPM